MITLTDAAASKVREIMDREQKTGWNLRMGVRSGGCCGMEYLLGFDNETAETDEVFTNDGITLVCDNESYAMLKGTEIDFLETPEGVGFVIKNPNSAPGCNCDGCGESCDTAQA
jgi:iron-sulfur cluster assembly accessory protein